MDRLYYFTIAKNEQGEIDYDYGCDNSENIETFTINHEEYTQIDKTGLFDEINNEYGTNIELGESADIPYDYIDKILEKIKNLSLEIPNLIKAFESALKYKKVLHTDF